MANKSFSKFIRSEEARRLIADHPTAFLLLAYIVQIADYRNGKALVGDCKVIGKKTTEQAYRTAKKVLAAKGIVSFKGIPKKGTVATIISDRIFSIRNNSNGINNGINNGNSNGNSNGHFELESGDSNGIDNGNSNGNNNRHLTSIQNKGRSNSTPLIFPPESGDNAGKPAKNKRVRFKKPTVEEIKAYCSERENGIDAKKFFDYYESIGWKRGKAAIKDWKACVRTWEKNNQAGKVQAKTQKEQDLLNSF